MAELPVISVLPEIKEALRGGRNVVLTAPPGAGKTTAVPPALLAEPWLAGRRIIMLQPRRLAARMAARYMAAAMDEGVGETVGYRVRLDSKVGPRTRLEVVTEGILVRMLQHDPGLSGVGLVIFDEFHERSLDADLGLALALEAQAVLRDDLRLMVMSATLDAGPVAALLGGAPVVAAAGRAYPVETIYRDKPGEGPVERRVAAAVVAAARAHDGDILAFLPGAGEIRRTAALLESGGLDGMRVAPLYGNLSSEAQDAAILPSPPGGRKVVLATSIAETSLTVEGVTVVVDSGLARVPRFSPRTGMTRLETVPVSLAAADQRRGRAGRLGPGVCYRLWTREEERQFPAHTTPEMLEADLAPLALELAVWGARDAAALAWLDRPPQGALAQARELLTALGALTADGTATPHGRALAAAGVHPRLAHMIVKGKALGLGALACEVAALLGGRDVLAGEGGVVDADLRLRLDALHGRVDSAGLRQAAREAAHLKRQFAVGGAAGDTDGCGLLVALAYPERIAQRRADGRYLLAGGRGAALPRAGGTLAAARYLAVAEADDRGADGLIYLAAPLAEEELYRHMAEAITAEETVAWDAAAQAVRARRVEKLGAIALKEGPLARPDGARVLAALLAGIAAAGLDILPWTKAARQLCERVAMLRLLDGSWPDMGEAALAATLDAWLGPQLWGLSRREELARVDLAAALAGMLTWEQRRALDELAPTHITVPSGSRLPVDYGDPAAPALAVRLQEVFGLADTPRVAGGRVAVTLHLLSPARRPVQVTRDLASFWRSGYFEVRKELAGRYPKHYWPDDPLAATPTSRVRPRE